MAKFSKFNNPNKKRSKKKASKYSYIPTFEELDYCQKIGISPQEYVNIKFNNCE